MTETKCGRLIACLQALRATVATPVVTSTIHGVAAAAFGFSLLFEDAAGFAPAVYDGPRGIAPLTTWGAALVLVAVVILAGHLTSRLRGTVDLALAVLAAVWAAFAAGFWSVAPRPEAAAIGGIVMTLAAVLAARDAVAANWTHTHPC